MFGSRVQIGPGPRGSSHRRLPPHCVRSPRLDGEAQALQRRLRRSRLHSVCEEARCPNRSACWSGRHVAFLLLGSVCTRACRFCAVATGRPASGPDPQEAERVGRLAAELDLAHVVLTSVNRDDLPDGGAAHFAATVRAIRDYRPAATVEVLTPDFRGDLGAVAAVCASAPDVYNHNVETVARLYRRVRPGATLERSLAVLAEARRRRPDSLVKSGLMVGLGESFEEVVELLRGLRGAGVDAVTVGQYLRPTRRHLPVERYWHPHEFTAVAAAASDLGFAHVSSGPLVRSSFGADETLEAVRARRRAGDRQAACGGGGARR
jgi:lipoic acid synthetase